MCNTHFHSTGGWWFGSPNFIIRDASHRRLRVRRPRHRLCAQSGLGRGGRKSGDQGLDGRVRIRQGSLRFARIHERRRVILTCTFSRQACAGGRRRPWNFRQRPGARKGPEGFAVAASRNAGRDSRQFGVGGGVGAGSRSGTRRCACDCVLARLSAPHIAGPVGHVAACTVQSGVGFGQAKHFGRFARLIPVCQVAQAGLVEQVGRGAVTICGRKRISLDTEPHEAFQAGEEFHDFHVLCLTHVNPVDLE